MIEIKSLDKYYRNGDLELHALKNVNIRIFKGEFVAIMGSSGSGKSTFMNVLGCLDKSFEGSYILDSINIEKIVERNISKIRNEKIGFVFQAFNLLPSLTAIENVELPLIYSGMEVKQRRERAKSVLEKVGLGDRLNHKPNELSGGQKQRVAIARALVNDPAIILADEPTGNLDSHSEEEIMKLFMDLNASGTTVVIVSHEPEIAKYCKRIIIFKDGKVISDGGSN